MSFRDIEIIDLIINTIEADLFRYIVVQYNFFPAVHELQTALQLAYPDRKVQFISIYENGYEAFIQKIYAAENEIVIVPDFDLLLENDTWRIAFNQQRDQLSLRHTVNLLACFPDEKGYFDLCARGMADFWSIRNLAARLEVDFQRKISDEELFEMIMESYYPVDTEKVEIELKRIEGRLSELHDNEGTKRLITELLLQKSNLQALLDYKALIERTHYNDVGIVFFLKKEYERAKNNLKASIRLNLSENAIISLATSYYHLALFHYTLQDPIHGKIYLEKAAETLPKDNPNWQLISHLRTKINMR